MELKNRPLNSESFSVFFKNIPIPTFAWQIVGEELVLIDFNIAIEKLSFEGVSLGIKASELFEDDGRILTNLFSCLEEKSNFSEECGYQVKKTGEQKKFSTSFIFLPPDLVILHIEDLTMQIQLSKALQKARDVLTGLQSIINQSPAVIFLLRDEEGWPVDYITDNIRQFGYDPSDFYSHKLKFTNIIHPDDLENVVTDAYLKCQNSATEFLQEYRIISKLGDNRWINVRTWIKRNRENAITHFQGIILDITERREIEEKLKESDEKFRIITEQSLLGVVIFQKGKVKYINKALAEIGEFETKEIQNWPIDEFVKSIYPEDLPMVMENMQVKLEDNKEAVTRYIFRILTKSKKIKWLEIISKTINYQGDLALIATLIDVTEKKEAEIKLKKSEENLKKLNEALEQQVSERSRDLKKSEEKFRNIADQSLMGICIVQEDIIKYANQRISDIVGYSLEEILNSQPKDFYKPIATKSLDFVSEQAKKKQLGLPDAIPQYPLQIFKKSGKKIWIEIFSKTINFNGRPADLVTFFDITDKKKVEQKLKESEAKLSTAIESLPFPIFMLDISGRYIMQNTNAKKTWGDLIGKAPKDIAKDEETLSLLLSNNSRVFSGETIANEAEYDINGESRYFFDIFAPVYVDDKIQNILGVNIDITARKQAEQELKESVEKHRLITENAIDLICIVDNKWKFQYCNEAYERILGYNPDDLIGTSSINLIHPEDRSKAFEEFRNSFYTGLGRNEARLRCKDGTYKWMESFGRIIFDENGKFKQSVGISRDITKRKRAEQRLKESELEYKEAYNKAEFYKDIFTHDINNILSNLKSSIELSAIYLKEPNRITDVEDLYEIITEQFTKCSNLVSNIRKLSQIVESDSLVSPIEIYDILKKEIDFIHNSYQTREIKIRTHGFKKGALIDANDLLIDLFDNLLNNSVKYNDSHVVEIDIKMSKEKKNNKDYIKLEFSDNGIGIHDKRKVSLFEREYVKDISSKGLGIGLTLVKKIVESYKGEIWIEDRIKGDYSQGANFIVLIPEGV